MTGYSEERAHAIPRFDAAVDYYAVLQVHPSAHGEVIKRAYYTILKLLQAHPDLGGNHEDAVRLNEAYAVLSHPEARKAYDRARQQRAAPPRAAVVTPPAPATPSRQEASSPRRTCYCPHCGARNRLPGSADPHQALCGKCHAPLASDTETAEPPVSEIKLSVHQTDRLATHGELRLQRATLPPDGMLHCLRCRHAWTTDAGTSPPDACPHCHSRRWSDFRLFQCQWCGHRFVSGALIPLLAWPRPLWPWPYWLFPTCPACRTPRWHRNCERHPLHALFNRMAQP